MSVNEVASFNCFGLKGEDDIPSVDKLSVCEKETNGQSRSRKELSLKEKLEILKMYDKLPKMSQRSAAIQLNISQPVLCKILKNRSFIEDVMLTNKNSVRKRTRGGKEREVESALKLWYIQVREKNIPINGQIIRKKAKELAKEMGKEFAATDGWFTRWRKRENVVYNSLLRRKFKSEKEFDCLQNGSSKPWVDIHETSQDFNDMSGENFTEASKKYVPDSLDCHRPVRISSKCEDPDERKSWETRKESFSEVFIKSEPLYEEEFEVEQKSNTNPPTDEEMLKALKILTAGVKHRTTNLQLHYKYEKFIYQLLRTV